MEVERRNLNPYRNVARQVLQGAKLVKSVYDYSQRTRAGRQAAANAQKSIKDYLQPSKKRKRSTRESGDNNRVSERKKVKSSNKGQPRAQNQGMARNGRNPRFTKSKGPSRTKKRKGKKVLVSSKQVKKWNKASTNALGDMGIHHEWLRHAHQTICAANESIFENSTGTTVLVLQSMMDQLPVTNTSGATVTFNDTSFVGATRQQKVLVEVGSNCIFANNFGTPVWVDVYCFEPNKDTGLEPSTTIDSGLADNGAVSNTNFAVYPSWSKEFTSLWNIHKHKRVCLAPGESCNLGYKKKFQYQPAVVDSHSLEYQKRYGGHCYGVRVEGTIGHSETTATNVGTGIAGVDWLENIHVKVTYPAGTKMINYKVTDNATVQTGGTVVGWPSNAANTIYTTDA